MCQLNARVCECVDANGFVFFMHYSQTTRIDVMFPFIYTPYICIIIILLRCSRDFSNAYDLLYANIYLFERYTVTVAAATTTTTAMAAQKERNTVVRVLTSLALHINERVYLCEVCGIQWERAISSFHGN